MAKRTINLSLATYTDAKGNPGAFGFKGDEVDVHDDFVEEFDKINVEQGEPAEWERIGGDVLSDEAIEDAKKPPDIQKEDKEEQADEESEAEQQPEQQQPEQQQPVAEQQPGQQPVAEQQAAAKKAPAKKAPM